MKDSVLKIYCDEHLLQFVDISFLEGEIEFVGASSDYHPDLEATPVLVTEDIELIKEFLIAAESGVSSPPIVIFNLYRSNLFIYSLSSVFDGWKVEITEASGATYILKVKHRDNKSTGASRDDLQKLDLLSRSSLPVPRVFFEELVTETKKLFRQFENLIDDRESSAELSVASDSSGEVETALVRYEDYKTVMDEKARLAAQLQRVEKRYEALASSKLGSLTLKYWNRKKAKK